MYRCVKSNDSDEVLAIGMDEGQGGNDYHGVGTWCEFTVESFPEVPLEYFEVVKKYPGRSLFKVVNNEVVLKTLEEVSDEP